MSLADSSIRIRPRLHWEAHDLGFVMARRWFVPLVSLWFMTCLPIAASLLLTLGADSWIPFLLLWWLKPLYEWPLVYWISQRVFATAPTIKQSFTVFRPKQIVALLPYLLWRRLSPQRTFTMPVGMLEGLKGAQRSQRVDLLAHNQSAASWLIVMCFHFEAVLLLGVYLAVQFFSADPLNETVIGGWTIDTIAPWLNLLFMVLVMALIAPFFVAAGFAAYLARRTQLEAWDLELMFRDLGQRLRNEVRDHPEEPAAAVHLNVDTSSTTAQYSKANSATLHSFLLAALAPLASVVLACSLLVGHVNTAHAQDHEPEQEVTTVHNREEAKALLSEVLSDKDFGEELVFEQWQYRKVEEALEEEEENIQLPFVKWLAVILELVMWVLVFALLIWGGIYLANALGWITPNMRQEAQNEVFHAQTTPEDNHLSLPDDIAAAVAALLQADQIREALALLYRASLQRLASSVTVPIPESATEGECRRWVRAHCQGPQAQYFDHLAKAWIQAAYGTRLPERARVEQLHASWSQWFEVST